MADLEVDLDGLDALAGRLDRIRGTLGATRGTVDAVRGDLGSGELADSLDGFERHWHDGRERIDTDAATLTSMVRDSVSAYRRTDADLAGGLRRAVADGPEVLVPGAPR